MKAFIIDEPWISMILAGDKTWEMRKVTCKYRGPVALIRKGSGHIVGVATLIDSLLPLTDAKAYAAAEPHHGIPPSRQEQARRDGWTTPWVLAGARHLRSPVRYRHPFGAVIWVTLEPGVLDEIAVQLDVETAIPVVVPETERGPSTEHSTAAQIPPRPNLAAQSTSSGHNASRVVEVTGGNIRHHHFYLPLEFFPADTIGGSNKQSAAPRRLTVRFEPGQTVSTDIDGTKRILRARGVVRDFFERAGVVEGDKLVIGRESTYAFCVSKVPVRS